jgi:nucleotide-binding universal stress UspA family protein
MKWQRKRQLCVKVNSCQKLKNNMKTILIATDFSKASRSASLYGWQLGKAMKANVILFTAYPVSHPIAALNVKVPQFDPRMQIEKKLVDESDLIVNGDGSQMDIICEEGVTHDAILTMAVEKGADLIILGMNGSGRNFKKLFGSTTTALIKDSKIPVLVVPEEATFTAPKRIVYASGVFMDITIDPIDQIGWLTHFFNSKLFVVRVVKDSYEEVRESVNTPQNLRKELKKLATTFDFPVNTNITDGLKDFIKEQTIDLLVMSPHKHEWFDRIFQKSETNDIIFHSHVPLLVIPDASVEVSNKETFQAIENYSSGK